jgi:pyruvate,water dikinase
MRKFLKGIGASRGKVEGRVIIVNGPREFSKMKKGYVLVAPMTSPSWLMVIHQAAAIVTDKGGMLSHAAIVCREFGIPAIVGTQEATKLLKDGDRILVDGTQGIIYEKR